MSSTTPLVSYADNREDVVLWRALSHVSAGAYIDVSAHDDTKGSISRAFYDRGWSGVVVEPLREVAEAHRAARPRDTIVEAALTDEVTAAAVVEEIGTIGLERDVQFMAVDAGGFESLILAKVDLRALRPWILVIRATGERSTVPTHDTWEPDVLTADYHFCLFDGVSRYYVAKEHAGALQARLTYPACTHDAFVDARTYAALQGRDALIEDLRRWRAEALTWWPGTDRTASAADLKDARKRLAASAAEISAMRATLSWRITRPIRALRGLVGRA